MEEGRQIDVGHGAQPSDKVVRLPRDWLGPREHLVPFGNDAATVESEPFAPSAEDFWGEHAAAIHDVVQAPEAPPRPDPPARQHRFRRGRLAAACLATLIVAGAAVVAILVVSAGAPRHVRGGGARLDVAAILSHGASRIHPPQVVVRATARRAVKHSPHRSPRRKPTAITPRHQTAPPQSVYVAHTTVRPTQPTYHPIVTRAAPHISTTHPPAASRTSSAASVRPTGQSGALGPVQSPNG